MSFGSSGFGGFGTNNSQQQQQQSSGFGGFGSTTNNNASGGRLLILFSFVRTWKRVLLVKARNRSKTS